MVRLLIVVLGIVWMSSSYAVAADREYERDYDVIIGDEPAPRSRDVKKPGQRQQRERSALDHTFGVIGGNYAPGSVTRVFGGTELGFEVPLGDRGRLYVSGEAIHSSVELTLERNRDPDVANMGESDLIQFYQEGRDLTGVTDESLTALNPTSCDDTVLAALASSTGVVVNDAIDCLEDGGVIEALAPRERELKVTKNEADLRDAFLQYELIDDFVVYVGRRRQVWGQFDLFSPVGILLPVRFQSNAVDYKKTNYVVPQDNASISWFLGERLELQGHYFLSTQIDPLLEEVIDMESTRDVEDHSQYAGRLIYRPDWGTVGLTFYKGRTGLFQYSNASFANVGTTMAEVDDEQADLPPLTAYAFEMAIPSGRWVWKTEIVYRESKGDLPSPSGTRITRGSNEGACRTMTGLDAFGDYLCSVYYRNNGSFVIDTQELFAGFGVDARLDDWLVNFGIYLLSVSEDSTVMGTDLRERAKAAGFSDDGEETAVFPTANIVYSWGDEDRYKVGVSGGFLVAAIGAALYSSARFGDNLSVYAGANFVQTVTDTFIEESNETPIGNLVDYELQDDFSFGARFGIRYAF